jgi:hypothetical protein
VQRTTLKTGVKPDRRYDPAPLLAVPRLSLSPDGVLGAADGAWVVDVHHRAHPHTKSDNGLNGVSVGFTGHYAAMRQRFGERLTLGCAGENLIAETPSLLRYEDVAQGFAIVGPDGAERARLRVLQVAHPCRPFTGWALGGTVESSVLKEHLQFLEDGMRGYYCVAEGAGLVEVGDLLFAL